MIRGSAAIRIDCSPDVVFDMVTDVSRMGDWSPECTGGEWLAPATGPVVDAEFLGHNVTKLGPIPLKKWTTTSVVTRSSRGEIFEFVTEDYTRWRYEFIGIDGATRVTESFHHAPYEGLQKLMYGRLLKRSTSMVGAMKVTLEAMKQGIEADQRCV